MVDSKVAEGFVELTIDTATLTRGLSRAQKSITRTLGTIQKTADRVGKRLSIALTAPLLAAGIASGKVAGTFETNMAKIVGLVGIAADEVNLLGKAVLELGPQVGKGPIELSKALFTITSAGARGQDALDLLTASAKAATAGLGETEDVAKATASAMQAFSKDNLTAAQTISILVNIVKKGNLEGRDLANTFSRVTAFAASLGIALNEAGAAMAVISLTAPDASQAATQLEALFRSLGRSTPIFEEALEKLGLSFEGVQAQLQQDGLLATLRTLQTEATRTGTRLNELFVDSSATAGAMAILNIDAGIVDDTFRALAQTTEEDLDTAFRSVADTGAFKFTQAMVSIQTAATQLGQVILPILAPIIENIAAAATAAGNAFADLDPEMQKSILAGVALVAVLGPALIIFGLMVGAISSIVTALGFLATGFVTLSVAALTPIAAILGAIFSIPVAIAAAITTIFLFKDAIKESFSDIGIIISGEFELAFAKAKVSFASFVKTVQEFDFQAYISGVKERFLELVLFIVDLPKNISDGLDSASKKFDEFKSDAKAFLLGEDFRATKITFGFKPTIDLKPTVDKESTKKFLDEIAGVAKPITLFDVPTDEELTKLKERVEKAGSDASDNIKDRFSANFDEIKDNAGAILDEITGFLSKIDIDIPGFDKFTGFVDELKNAAAELSEVISENFDKALKNLQDRLKNTKDTATSVAESIKEVITDVTGTISSSITNVITGTTSALDALKNIANAIIGSIISSLVGTIGGGGLLGSLFGSAKGNVFSGGAPVPFADGGIISGRTIFPMANGGRGLAGEAGNEAIFPLTRVAGGGLGISAEGVSNDNIIINQVNNFTPDVRATVREEIANAAPLLINAAKQATLAALNGRRI